jgi:hypothetical protein
MCLRHLCRGIRDQRPLGGCSLKAFSPTLHRENSLSRRGDGHTFGILRFAQNDSIQNVVTILCKHTVPGSMVLRGLERLRFSLPASNNNIVYYLYVL